MNINAEVVSSLREKYGEAFYLLDSVQFKQNYVELRKAFTDIYPRFNIAYSFKTNYIPDLCHIVKDMGGYAEVVSEMELELAYRVGFPVEKIVWNGPIKTEEAEEKFLLNGGVPHIDGLEEAAFVVSVAKKHSGKAFNVGLRCNFDVNDGVLSRFGFDIDGHDINKALSMFNEQPNIHLKTIHCHFAKRHIDFWPARAKGICDFVKRTGIIPDKIDIGGGLFGKMAPSLKEQFPYDIPSYEDYAKAAATEFKNSFADIDNPPELVIEPGSALVGDCMKFVGTVKTIKCVRGKYIATVLGSQKNISMTGVNPPAEVIAMGGQQAKYQELDFVGFTCIEGDSLYRGYNGTLAVGDALVISNCGSYSIVMKPPFILPNFPILDICGEEVKVIKRKETFEDVFHTYNL